VEKNFKCGKYPSCVTISSKHLKYTELNALLLSAQYNRDKCIAKDQPIFVSETHSTGCTMIKLYEKSNGITGRYMIKYTLL